MAHREILSCSEPVEASPGVGPLWAQRLRRLGLFSFGGCGGNVNYVDEEVQISVMPAAPSRGDAECKAVERPGLHPGTSGFEPRRRRQSRDLREYPRLITLDSRVRLPVPLPSQRGGAPFMCYGVPISRIDTVSREIRCLRTALVQEIRHLRMMERRPPR